MGNLLENLTPELWSSRMQRWIKKSAVFMALANMEERKTLSVGDTVHRPYSSDMQVNDYTKGTAVTIQDLDSTDEYLTVDTTKEVSFYVDNIDKIQNLYSAADERTKKSGYRLSNEMDGAFLAQATNATYDFDDGDMGGTDGNPITVSASNVVKLASLVKAKMNTANIEWDAAWDLVIDPMTASYIEQSVVANGFNTADLALKNGYAGDFMWFKVFVSNNLKHTDVLTLTGNVSADDTFTYGWVTFTFKASPSAAGEVDLGADAETSIDNLAAAITGWTGAGTTYIEVSEANRRLLKNLRVSESNTATTLTLTSSGDANPSESLDNATLATTVVSALAEKRWSIDMVVQQMPTTQINKVSDKTGYNFISYDLYGLKTFKEGRDRMVEVKIAS